MPRLVIRHEMGCTDGSDEERELEAITDAVDLYQQAINVMRRVGVKGGSGTGSFKPKDMTVEPEEPISNGQQLALRMQAAYPDQDWIALIAERSDEPREKIEWHLQQDIAPTGAMLLAAGELLVEAQEREVGGCQPLY